MINKTILQTSKYKPTQKHMDEIAATSPGWAYRHFDDNEILTFFKDNPIPGFEEIEKRFYELRRGEHRADLFRYYYIYLYGGFFIDLDLELLEDLNKIIKDESFVSAEIKVTDNSILSTTKRARIFNGYMYASPKHPIVYQALSHLYFLDLDDLGPEDGSWDSRYHVVCEQLYNIVVSQIDKSGVKLFTITDDHNGSFIFDGEKIIAHHRNSSKA